ncbi:hypothetical protein GLOIN_2v1482909 [Rhizophagus clarus]|uniref:DUF659 domain-containing protein n=1 Tax=Rhizophagus clarus TaxID=94130 RepID=A0A8H3LRK8_9GLOM|nr:hypothetical protein GLOIN_2v1482909 [Rhizophagus clarus]
MSLQNKRVKYDTRLIKDSTNRTGNTDENELQHYTESCYFVDDIDDINDDINDDIESSKNSTAKANITNKKRKGAAKKLTSFVWKYFKKGKDSNSATCYVIKEDGEKCGHYYNDGSTTSNLIHYLTTKHKIYKPESAKEPQLDIRVAIKKRKPKSETEYKQIWQNVTEFIIEDNQPLYVLQTLQRVRYPYTGEIIKELLNKIFADWAIASKLLTMTTDNGTHTLQLTIGKGLNLVKTLILQNSTYYAWDHLIELKRAIKFLPGQLKSDLNKDAQKDGEKLEKIMLSDNEWLLIEDLLNLLSVFEDVTKLLSADDLPDKEITILDSAEVTISDNENEVEIEVVDLTAVTGRCRKKIDITEPIQTKDIVSNIRKLLYNSMFSYWKDIHKVGMLAYMIYASPNPADSSEEIDKYLEINEECKEANPLE